MNTLPRIKAFFTSPRVVAATLLVALMTLGIISPVGSQTVLHGYSSTESLQRGMLVASDSADQTKIQALTDNNLGDLKGVIADKSDSTVTLSSGEDKYFVATSGIYEALVSSENGNIGPGDLISISSLSGVGSRATDAQETILGRAVNGFDGSNSVGKTVNSNGETISFGRIAVDIAIGNNPIFKPAEPENLPNALERIASEIAGKQISPARVYLALTILIIITLISTATLFSGVRSTVIAIGRNPLSRGIIYKGLLQVTLLSFIIFITGLFAVYLLIKL